MARSLAPRRLSHGANPIEVSDGSNSHMMIGWIIHNPTRVTTINDINCRFLSPSVALKVKLRLATKLKKNEIVVEKKLAAREGSPSAVRLKRMIKSSAVLAIPTRPKRAFSRLFFMATMVVFLYKIQWSTFGLIEDSPYVFTDNTK